MRRRSQISGIINDTTIIVATAASESTALGNSQSQHGVAFSPPEQRGDILPTCSKTTVRS